MSWLVLVWMAILVVILVISAFTVSPVPPDDDAGEPPP